MIAYCRNVQVTLQILTALIEKSPKDLPLYATNILTILDQILKSHDITMVESSIPTFEAFCENHDATSLLADQAYFQQYVSVIRQYASLASTRTHPGKSQPSKPVALRWRNSGLEAIRSLVSADALSSVNGRQYHIVVPMILENLWTDNEDFLEVLLQRAQMEEKVEAGALLKRRTSVATVRTADTGGNEANTNPIALVGSAFDVDKLAEEDTGVLAMQCLKMIFEVPNRSLIHAATTALLRFIEERVNQLEDVVRTNFKSGKDSGWAIKMFGLVARWAPVQDRYAILVTALDGLQHKPLTDETLQQHIVVIAMVQALLRSDVNLIGLSVMDVLLQLISSMRRLVQMPGDPNGMRSDPPGPDNVAQAAAAQGGAEKGEWSAAQRKELLSRLQHCIGDLATHVYYTDQISDMIATILVKLKPKPTGTSNSTPQGEKADETTLADETNLDSLFHLTVAKTAALRSIKSIILVANPRGKPTDNNVRLSRNRVPIQVWEGTHWLLSDPDGHVRKAYVEALLTWLDRETTAASSRARDETLVPRSTYKNRDVPGLSVSVAKRAVSSASNRGEKTASKVPRSHFLQLLHVAIYDNALHFVDYETDMVLLHVLLAKLVIHLGVNAVRYGLPMVFRLQEDIQDANTPSAKVRIGSLVHGYFWVLTEKFDFEASVVGRAVHNEIVRRRSKNFWVEGVHIPPPLPELVGTPGTVKSTPKLVTKEVETEALLPFDDRLSLVECVCTGYTEQAASPPSSPSATSPGRSFSHPVLGSTLSATPAAEPDKDVPSHFRELMLMDWSREAVLIAVQAGSNAASLTGSRTGTNGTGHGSRLAANGGVGAAVTNGHARFGASSPHASKTNLRPASSPGPAPAAGGGLLAQVAKMRKTSVRSNVSRRPGSSSSRAKEGVTSVEQLKLVLSGHLQPPATAFTTGALVSDSDSSDSLVSYDMTPSELSFNPAAGEVMTSDVDSPPAEPTRPVSRERKPSLGGGGPLSSHPTNEFASDEDGSDDVPPVPPLPAGIEGKLSSIAFAPPPQPPSSQPSFSLPRPTTGKRSIRSRGGGGGDRVLSSSWGPIDSDAPAMDLESLLKGIDSRAGERALGTVTKPPY